MSWYNNTNESSFQDSTQLILGGSGGGGSTSTTIIQNGDDISTGNTGYDTTVNDLISLRFDDPYFNVYVTNKNANGVIYFRTSDNNNKVKIENGRLYVWYDYNPAISLTITSGWTHIADYIVTTRQGQLNNAVNVGVLDVAVLAPATGLVSRVGVIEPVLASTVATVSDHGVRINRLELVNDLGEPSDLELENALDSTIDQFREELGTNSSAFMDMVEEAGYSGGNAQNLATNIRRSRLQLAQSIFTNLFAVIGGLSAVVGLSYQIYDRYRSEQLLDDERNIILAYEKAKDQPIASVANLLHETGLTITQSTNNNFLVTGTFDVDIQYNNTLTISIKNISGTLQAVIDDVKQGGVGYSVNDVIQIPKTSLGASTGTLDITVTTLYSELQILAFDIDLVSAERDSLVGRNRRRQFIPDKNDFGDGLNITETNVTEPSGEITKSLDISLKLDTGQFSYDANGNLQLTNYNNLIYTNANGSVGINTTTPSASYKLDIVGDVNYTGDLYQNGSLLQLGSKWTTSGNNIYYSTGLVGIGASPTLSSTYKLQVDGGGFFKNDIVLQSSSTPSIWLYRESFGSFLQQAYMYIENSGDHKFAVSLFDASGVTPSTGFELRINNVRKFSVFNDGNVGIGTQYTSPSHKLDVDGNIACRDRITLQGTTNPQLWLLRQDANGNTLQNGFVYVSNVSPNNLIINHNDASGSSAVGIDMRINNSQVLKIENNGNTRIGAYSPTAPAYKLEVVGDINFTGSLYQNGSAFTSGGSTFWTENPLTSGEIYYNGGNVGIGIADPDRALHIQGYYDCVKVQTPATNGGVSQTFSNNVAGGNAYIGVDGANFKNVELGALVLGNSPAKSILFYTGSTEKMRISSTGNVGIGTNTTPQKLNVEGALYLTGSPSNPGNNSSASFWNQANVGATISGYNFAVNTNGTVEAMRITQNGEVCLNASSGNPNHTNAKLYIVDGGSISSYGTAGAEAMIEVRGGLGGGVPAGKNGLNVIHNNGSQGIGVGFAGIAQLGYSVNAPLYLWGRGTPASGQILNANVIIQDSSQNNKFISYTNGDIWYSGSFNSSSDIRIKKNVRDIDDKEALNKILLIEPKKYEYIDPEKGTDTVIGFIAQNIREVIPEATRITDRLIPNVLQNCRCDIDKIYINIPDIQVGHKLNIRYDEIDNDGVKTGMKSGVNLLVKEIHDDYILLENMPNYEDNGMIPKSITECFVYGYEVDDFINIRKDYLFTLNVSATQELHKIIMEQQNQIDMLKEILARNGIV